MRTVDYRTVLLERAARAQEQRELEAQRRHDPFTWWRNRQRLHDYSQRMARHLQGRLFPDPRVTIAEAFGVDLEQAAAEKAKKAKASKAGGKKRQAQAGA